MIQKKLNVLKDNKVIGEEAYDHSQETLIFLKNRKIIKEDTEADVFITHLAMAFQRQNTDEKIEAIDEEILEEILLSEHFESAQKIWKDIKGFSPIDFDKDEDGYFYLHLVTLLQNQ